MSHLRKTSKSIAWRSTIAAAIALALSSGAQAAYISDGDFEAPTVSDTYNPRPTASGVTFQGDAGIATGNVYGGSAPAGQYGYVRNYSDSTGSHLPGTITFAVTGLNAGSTYDVNFVVAQRSTNFPFAVLFDDTQIALITPTQVDTFQSLTTSFLATNSIGFLEFSGFYTVNSAAGFSYFDNVVITARDTVPGPDGGTVPEPAPIALLGLGLIGGVYARRRSKAALPA